MPAHTSMRTLNISDQLLASSLESKQRTKTFETGLLIAHHGAKVDTILRLVPTPSADSKSAATTLDADWMLAHAAQVSRMLPGGIVVLGVYVFAPNAKLSSMEPKLQQLLGSLLKQLPAAGPESNPAALLLPTDAKKASCKALLPPGAARLQPLEIKTTRTAAALHCFTCDLALDVPLRLSRAQCAAGPAGAARGVLHAQLAPHLSALRGAVVMVEGGVPAAGALVEDLRGEGGLGRPHAVELFATSPRGAAYATGDAAPAAGEEGDEEADEEGVAVAAAAAAAAATGEVSFSLRGVLHGRAFATAREEVAEVVAALRRDITRDAAARVAALLEELEEAEGEEEEEEAPVDLGRVGAWTSPRRVHVDVGDGLSLCDYVGEGEGGDDVAERMAELLDHTMVAGAALGPETAQDDAASRRLLDVPLGGAVAAKGATTKATAAKAPKEAAASRCGDGGGGGDSGSGGGGGGSGGGGGAAAPASRSMLAAVAGGGLALLAAAIAAMSMAGGDTAVAEAAEAVAAAAAEV